MGFGLLNEAGQANPEAILLGLMTFMKTLKRLIMLEDYIPGFKENALPRRDTRTRPKSCLVSADPDWCDRWTLRRSFQYIGEDTCPEVSSQEEGYWLR